MREYGVVTGIVVCQFKAVSAYPQKGLYRDHDKCKLGNQIPQEIMPADMRDLVEQYLAGIHGVSEFSRGNKDHRPEMSPGERTPDVFVI